jgi:putative sporulation protein YtaF
MSVWLSLIAVSFAVSLDGFGVGMTYGLRKIKIPLMSLAIILCCSAGMILLTMFLGIAISRYFSPDAGRMIGAVILILIGAWTTVRVFRQKISEGGSPPKTRKCPAGTQPEGKPFVFMIEIKKLGIVIQILKTPAAADMDDSGVITTMEAFLLGLALSLDAFGAGIGAAMMGLPALWTPLAIAGFNGLLIHLGLRFGRRCADWQWMQKLVILPGLLLILIGVMKML